MKNCVLNCLLSYSILFALSGSLMAQQPAWVDYAKRTSTYPTSEYLVGYVSVHNTNGEDPGELMDKYEELAKSKVIQSIQVSIETNNSLLLSNVNGDSDEEFQSKSISFSNAIITGLKAERYYDRKKDDVYAFAYASKKDLAYYNRKLIKGNLLKIQQKLNEGRDYLSISDKQNALKSFYEGMPLLAEAEKAQWLLMAINQEQFIESDLLRIREIKSEVNNEISKLQQSDALSMSEAAYFVAYGLFMQLGESSIPISVDLITYENTDLISDFSAQWDTEIKNALVKTGSYKIQDRANATTTGLELKENYWQEGNRLRIHAQLINNNKLVAVSEGSISLGWLRDEGIEFKPGQLKKIENLESVRLQVFNHPEKLKIGRQSDKPVEVMVEKMTPNGLIPLPGIPVDFRVNDRVISNGLSNVEGLIHIYFPAISLPEGKTEITTQIDLASYADIDVNSFFYTKTRKNNPVNPAIFTVQLIPLIYFVNCNEIIDRKPVEIPIIEPEIKNNLAAKGYQFVDDKTDADYIINIKAATTAGNSYQGIYFSFVDATLSILNVNTGVETFKTAVEQVKGGGANSKKAGIKALNLASEQLEDKLTKYLSSK